MYKRYFDLLTPDFIRRLGSLCAIKRVVDMLSDYRRL